MMRHAILLVLFVLSSACGGAQRRPNDEVTTRMTVDDEVALDQGDQTTAGDRAAAVDRCDAAFANPGSDSAADAHAAAVACAELRGAIWELEREPSPL